MLSYVRGAGEIERLLPPQWMPVGSLQGVLAGRLHCFRLGDFRHRYY